MVNVFPQATLLMVHAVSLVLHDSMIPPFSAITDTRKWSASLMASQEIVRSFEEQLKWVLTLWGGQGAGSKKEKQ